MANTKTCATCGKEFIVSSKYDKELYYCHECEKVWRLFHKAVFLLIKEKRNRRLAQ